VLDSGVRVRMERERAAALRAIPGAGTGDVPARTSPHRTLAQVLRSQAAALTPNARATGRAGPAR
jgi:hypothetical protein